METRETCFLFKIGIIMMKKKGEGAAEPQSRARTLHDGVPSSCSTLEKSDGILIDIFVPFLK